MLVALVGAQWGDEGKGKVVDALGRRIDLIVHYAGGHDPGQTIALAGERLTFHLVPPGPLRAGTGCLLGQGMAIHPDLLLHELATLEHHGLLAGNLRVCQRAHVVLPHHVMIDALREEPAGASGVSRRGIGPCYGDKLARRGVQIGDLLSRERLAPKVEQSLAAAAPIIHALGGEVPPSGPIVDAYLSCGDRLRPRVVDGSRHVMAAVAQGKHVVLEGTLGTHVDVDHGTYPFVVAASTVAGGACTGTGVPPRAIDRVVGVAKAYTTRAGSGPFVPELSGALAARFQELGGEIVAATAYPRRVGMFDVPVVRYAARVNGFDSLALTKLDVLSGLDEVPVCMGYLLDGDLHDEPPFEGLSRAQPLTEMLPGWKESVRDCRSLGDLPSAARRYVETIAAAVGLPVCLIGVGPASEETIVVEDPFGVLPA